MIRPNLNGQTIDLEALSSASEPIAPPLAVADYELLMMAFMAVVSSIDPDATDLTKGQVVGSAQACYRSLCVAPDPAHNGTPSKRHETRHWFPFDPVPFAVAIHAAKKFDADNRASFTASPFRDALKRCGFYPGDPRPFLDRQLSVPGGLRPVPLGAIIGVATVVEILSAATPTQRAIDAGVQPLNLEHLTDDDRAFGYFVRRDGDDHPYRYAWRLADAVMFDEPIPHTGRQDPHPLYPPDLHTREAINAQLRLCFTASGAL